MTLRVRTLAFAVAVLTAAPAVWVISAAAQTLPPPPVVSTTTSTTAGSSTTTTSTPGGGTPTTLPGVSSTSTSTTAPPRSGGTTTTVQAGEGDGLTPTAAGTTDTIPPQYQAYIGQVARSAPNGTATLLGAILPLEDLGMTHDEAVAATFGHFPVAGPATFTDDWWYPRFNQPFHLHQGTDIFAAMGVPVRAPADGVLKHGTGGLGGLSSYVTQADGTYFYMAHLSAFVDGQTDGMAVKQGDIVGYVGNSGDAAGGATHVHFEIHMNPAANQYLRPKPPPPPAPAQGRSRRGATPITTTSTTAKPRTRRGVTATTAPPPPVIIGDIHDPVLYGRGTLPATDPKPFLDQWLAEDLANVSKVIAAAEKGKPRAIIDTSLTRRFADGGAGVLAGPTGPPRSQLLWATSASPAGGALRLAEAEVDAAAAELDYQQLARSERTRLADLAAVKRWDDALLGPLTPRALRSSLGLPVATR